MKKIMALFLTAVLAMSLCIPSYADNVFNLTPNDVTEDSNYNTEQLSTSGKLLGGQHYLGIEIDTGKELINMVTIRYRTGTTPNSIAQLYLDSPQGQLLGEVDIVAASNGAWQYSDAVFMPQIPIKGKVKLYLKLTGGDMWVHNFKINTIEDLGNASFGHFPQPIDKYVDIDSSDDEMIIDALTTLGVLEEYTDSDFRGYVPMTRMEFVRLVGKAMQAENFAVANTAFLDVPAENADAKLLDGLFRLGVVRGDGFGNFAPNSFITLQEATAVCLNALGYAPLVQKSGNAITVANQIKLLKGVEITSGGVAKLNGIRLIYNMLLEETLLANEVHTEGMIYETGATLLEKNLKIYHDQGVVTGNENTGLYSVQHTYKTLTIDNQVYVENDTGASDLLGTLCDYFYTIEDGARVLKAIYPAVKSSTVVLKSGQGYDFTEISTEKVVCEDDEDEYEYELSQTAAIIYNGVALDQYLHQLVTPSTFTGILTLIDNDQDELIDCLRIDHSRDIVVTAMNGNQLYDTIAGETINFPANGKILGFDDGQPRSLGTMPLNSVVSYFASANATGKQLVRMCWNNGEVVGRLTSKAGKDITINDQTYTIANNCRDTLTVGMYGQFSFNMFGQVVAYDPVTDDSKKVGYVLGTSSGTTTNLVTKAQIRVLTEDGIVILDQADTVLADGLSIRSSEALYNGVNDSEGAPIFVGLDEIASQPILYRLNQAGQFTMIDTVNPGAGGVDDGLTELSSGPSSYMNLSNILADTTMSGFPGRFPLKGDETRFIKLTADGLEKNYRIDRGFSNRTNEPVSNLRVYSFAQDSIMADLILGTGYNYEANRRSTPFIFKGTGNTTDDEGNVVKYIDGVSYLKDERYVIENTSYTGDLKTLIDSLQPGDLVLPYLTDGLLVNMELIYISDGAATNDAGIAAKLNKTDLFEYTGGGEFYIGKILTTEGNYSQFNISGKTTWETYVTSSTSVGSCTEGEGGKYSIISGQGISSIMEGEVFIACTSDQSMSGAFVYRLAE
ncbi:MAG: hypothetical protein E7393_05655 [Ruminococcaceae bacterium]|nr:hypothetical protein [Oscillospiraceae bacterium]